MALRARSRKRREQAAQLVHFLMVEADVGQHRDFRLVEGDRAVAFVDLADEQFGVADQGARERRGGRHEILHHRAVHHRRLAVAGVEDPADHPGDGRLAAGAADGDAALRVVEQFREELRAGQMVEAKLAGADDVGHGLLDRRGGDQGHARPAGPIRPAGTGRCRASADRRTWTRRGPASSERSEPATLAPVARTIEASGSMPLPPIPQKKMVDSVIAACPIGRAAYLQAPPPGQPVQPGPRTNRPGLAPVCLPSFSTCVPLTKTSRTPVAELLRLGEGRVVLDLGRVEDDDVGVIAVAQRRRGP